MNVPILNRKLILEDAFRVPDGAGGYETLWQPLGTHWAHLSPGAGRERQDAAVQRSRVVMRIMVRAAPVGSPARPTAGQRFREGRRTYDIIAVTERDTTGRYLTCHAEEEVVS